MTIHHDSLDKSWHTLSADAALRALDSDRTCGLSSGEAHQRAEHFGPNAVPPAKRRSAWMRFLMQFHNVLIYVLLASASVSALLGDFVDTGVIMGVVIIIALIGFIQEGKAESALEAIRRMLSLSAMVLRDGRRETIPAEQLVPGDIVFIQSGDKVPADLRLLQAKNLRIDEAPLTGESIAVEKSIAPVAENAVLGDRFCIAYSGTLVTYGQGLGVVVATGTHTAVGRISSMLTHVEKVETPLTKQMEGFSHWLTSAILLMAAGAFAFGLLVRGYPLDEMLMAVVGLAVAAIPEGLPAIVTITLAVGVQRMAKRNAIIRQLPAVETLGSVTVICSDKTGTLTRNEMTVQSVITPEQVFRISGVGYSPDGRFSVDGRTISPADAPELVEIARASLLCNDALLRKHNAVYELQGDPTEGALLTLASKVLPDPAPERANFPRIDAIPFESEHRFMATLHHDHEGHGFIFLKGAPEVVFEKCDRERRSSGDAPQDRSRWHCLLEQAAAEGQRLLAIAVKPLPQPLQQLTFADTEGGFILLALLGLIDPPREEAIRAVASCHQAGIEVKMITGDHALTAQAIGARLGISDDESTLTGSAIEALDDAALRAQLKNTAVFARTSPEHKLRLVQALQADGDIVSMTGDGVNDAPALKRADIGVAMGINGTEAAKEAADMVLADDNFASITHAVEEGRTVYDNLQKAIVYVLPTSFGEAGAIMVAILLGFTMPITPLQILWVNLVTAVTLSLPLAFEQPEENVMQRPPRPPKQPLLTTFALWRIVFVTFLLVAGLLGLFFYELGLGAGIEAARTAAVNTLVMGEIVYLFNSRYLYASAISWKGLFSNRYVLLAVPVLLVAQGLFSYLPVLQKLFGTADIDAAAWARIAAFGMLLFGLVEIEKYLLRIVSARKAVVKKPVPVSVRLRRGIRVLARSLIALVTTAVLWSTVRLAPGIYESLIASAFPPNLLTLFPAFCLIVALLLVLETAIALYLELRTYSLALDIFAAAVLTVVANRAAQLDWQTADAASLYTLALAILTLALTCLALALVYSWAQQSKRRSD
jgi:magnesium-transporting ATPase (P-type)